MVKFKDELLNSGKSPATINKYLQKLSLLFNWLANHQEGIVNHFAGVKLQRVKETKARSGYTAQERQRFVQWAKQQEPYRRWIALLGLYTGARANEICQLYADDVVLVDNVWCIKVQASRLDQKLKTDNVETHSGPLGGVGGGLPGVCAGQGDASSPNYPIAKTATATCGDSGSAATGRCLKISTA